MRPFWINGRPQDVNTIFFFFFFFFYCSIPLDTGLPLSQFGIHRDQEQSNTWE